MLATDGVATDIYGFGSAFFWSLDNERAVAIPRHRVRPICAGCSSDADVASIGRSGVIVALAAFEVGDGLRRIDAESAGDLEEFRDVEPPFATLELRHKGLRPAEPFRQGDLRQSGVATRLHEDLAELPMLPAEGRLRHAPQCAILLWNIPK